MNKGRATRPVRRMGTEVMEDRRTRRLRTRRAEEDAALEEEMWEAYAEEFQGEDPDGLDDIIDDLKKREERRAYPRPRLQVSP